MIESVTRLNDVITSEFSSRNRSAPPVSYDGDLDCPAFLSSDFRLVLLTPLSPSSPFDLT
jgi:hypothetical protein